MPRRFLEFSRIALMIAALSGAGSACAQDIDTQQGIPRLAAAEQTIAAKGKTSQETPLRGTIPQPGVVSGLSPGGPMRFRAGRRVASPGCGLECAEFIVATGEIQRDSATTLVILWNRLKRKDLPLFIDSPGGNLEGGLDLGRALRKFGVAVTVGRMRSLDCKATPEHCTAEDSYSGLSVFEDAAGKASCNSACVYTFAGGTSRSVAAESSVGIHQFFIARDDDRKRKPKESYSREDFSNLQRTVSEVASYLVEMGVSVNLLTLSADVDSQSIRKLTRTELEELRLTHGQGALTPSLPATAHRAPEAAQRSMALAPAATRETAVSFSEPDRIWPVVIRDGKPWLVLSMPSQSRRFGAISNEVAIGCSPDARRFTALFREIVPARPRSSQDASVTIGVPGRGEALTHSPASGTTQGAISRETALVADTTGVLVVEVTSSATAGYPMRLEFPGNGLKSGLDTLETACKR